VNPAQIYLIRHGETAWSRTGQHTGRSDIPLTEHGEAEARELAPRLARIHFSAVLVSPRLRARQTCELAGMAQGSETEPDLAEWDFGDYEGLLSVDIRKTHQGWNSWRDGSPGGELPADVTVRTDRLIARLNTMHGKVALFSHGKFSASLAARWIGLPIINGQHFVLHTASLSILGQEPGDSHLRVITLWNDTSATWRYENED
jgi:probable phosphoglycerate mutase